MTSEAMPTRLPPRREPRVLALCRRTDRLVWAVVDPWEVRGAGEVMAPPRSFTAAIQRLVRREKPTAVVSSDGEMRRRVGNASELAVLGPSADIPGLRVALDLYPELALYAPSPALRRAARLALAVVLRGAVPSRTYAPRRH